MSNFVSYYITPDYMEIKSQSVWECRNLGLNKIVNQVYKNLIDEKLIHKNFTLIINCGDIPGVRYNHESILSFDCTTNNSNCKDDIFPDYIFGNWWHIGLTNFDQFVTDIISYDCEVQDNRLFWIGNLQNIIQRHRYLQLCKKYPNYLYGESMNWTDNGSKPTKFITIKDHKKYKYLLDINGYAYANNQFGYSGRLKLLAFCNRPLFINDRNCYAWSDLLIREQSLHIPVNNNLDNLISQYYYAENNYNLVTDNSHKLLGWCIENFTFNKICDHSTKLIINKLKLQ